MSHTLLLVTKSLNPGHWCTVQHWANTHKLASFDCIVYFRSLLLNVIDSFVALLLFQLVSFEHKTTSGKMFNDLSAWFSSSVDDQCKQLWSKFLAKCYQQKHILIKAYNYIRLYRKPLFHLTNKIRTWQREIYIYLKVVWHCEKKIHWGQKLKKQSWSWSLIIIFMHLVMNGMTPRFLHL